ncbi:MAG: hypothetical protein Q8L78_06875 [Coxiellaceae bacterium]|nr:hypothetical protein [Coxiellaceae bacterium]
MSRESTSNFSVELTEEQVKVIGTIVDGLVSAIQRFSEGKIDHDAFIAEAKQLKGELVLSCALKQKKVDLDTCCSRFGFSKEKSRSFELMPVEGGLIKFFVDAFWSNNVLPILVEEHPDLVSNNSVLVEALYELGEGVVSPSRLKP